MMHRVIIVICATLSTQAHGQFAQWWSQIEQTAQQTASQFLTQATTAASRVANSFADFSKFIDKSQQFQRNFTASEVSQCTGQSGTCLYIVYDGKVLDLTHFAPHHPGGMEVLLQWAGRDASAAMRATGMPAHVYHHYLDKFCIGRLVPEVSTEASRETTARSKSNCGWLPMSMGLCDYIVKMENIYENYKGLMTRIYVLTNATYNKYVRPYSYGVYNLTFNHS